MNTDLILKNVHKHVQLNIDEERLFISSLEPLTLKRRTVHLKAGEVCKHSTFIINGALKGFTNDKNRQEHVINFALSDWWIADLYSLITQKPGVLTIEAIADSEVLLLSKEKQEMLYGKTPKFERFFRIITENSLVASQQRLINNLSLTAEERYLDFMEKYPFVMECAPLHSIASYLGITPEFLSKVRRRMAGKLH
jgi:CRP-like cAMP-binding protein